MSTLHTAKRRYPTPDLDEPPNGPNQFKQLADAIDADMQNIMDTVAQWQARQPYATAAGTTSLQPNGRSTATMLNINFPTGRFTVPPKVTANISNTAANTAHTMVRAQLVTKDSFSLVLMSTDDDNLSSVANNGIPVDWIAVQMTAASAAG